MLPMLRLPRGGTLILAQGARRKKSSNLKALPILLSRLQMSIPINREMDGQACSLAENWKSLTEDSVMLDLRRCQESG